MSAIDDLSRLKHIMDAGQEALSFIDGYNRADLDTNRMLALSLVKELEIIGEAANNISKGCQDRYPQVSWRAVVGMRNRLIHAYFGIDYDVVWQTVTESLPRLLIEVEAIIKNETNGA
jgi:uncharacterized protein with HEPN domain